MTDYISREAFLEHLRKDPLFDLVERYGVSGVIESFPAADVVEKEKYDRLLENSLIVSTALQEYQKADVAPVVHGYWDSDGHTVACSNCHTLNLHQRAWEYCPYCGAKMDGGDGDDGTQS